MHASLLPKYRGAAPIQWAILDGQAETGVTIMEMAEKLDTGGILAQRATAIGPGDTAVTLSERLARMGAQLLVETLAECVNKKITARPQAGAEATVARKIIKEDGGWIGRNRPAPCGIAFAPWFRGRGRSPQCRTGRNPGS